MKAMHIISLTTIAVAATAAAQAQNDYWSYDGKTPYATYQVCEQARTTRTIGGAAMGAAVGAGLGALAGGDDTRNAVVGGAAGALAGAFSARRMITCTQNRWPQTQSQYGSLAPHRRHNLSGASGHSSVYSQHGALQEYAPFRAQHHTSYATPVTSRRVYTYTAPVSTSHTAYGPVSYRQPQTIIQHRPAQPASPYSSPYPVSPAYWTAGDGRYYNSQQTCQSARRQRTLAGGSLGAVTGAGLGTLAGGNDRRNAAVGAVAGALMGARAGYQSINCYKVQ